MLYPNIRCRILTYDVVSRRTMSFPDIRCRILTYDVVCSILAYEIACNIATRGCVVRWHLPLQKDLAYNTSLRCCSFYHDVPENTLLNDVFCYFVHNLPKLQNMHMYKITRDTDINLVTTSYRSLAGPPSVPETYLFSKELVAYLETLIAFSVYYRADDPPHVWEDGSVLHKGPRRLQRHPIPRISRLHIQEAG
jgi:hypothetical protein